MSSDAVSVSKGCFAFKGKRKKASEGDYCTEGSDKYLKNRFASYKELWTQLSTRIETLRSDLNTKMFKDLFDFTEICHKEREPCAGKMNDCQEIPSAVLITGVNTPDHSVMFSKLEELFKKKKNTLVARLFLKDSGKLNILISSLVKQLTDVYGGVEDEDLDAEEQTVHASGEDSPVKLNFASKRRKAITMTTLVKWYEKTYLNTPKHQSSPKKKNRRLSLQGDVSTEETSEKRPPLIVIMLEDVENMPLQVLQDFISLCSTYLSSLPVVLVFGIATAITALHQLLPSSLSSLLCLEKFQAPPASQYLTQLMDQIIMTPEFPFRIGPRVFHFLLDIFLYHDFSILNFVLGFQYCMLEHFVRNPLSLLCCPYEEIDSVTSQLTHAQLEEIREQVAFKSFAESASGPLQASLFTDDQATRKNLAKELKNLHSYHGKFFSLLRFLHHMALSLPKHPLGKQLRELYSLCLTANICESEGFTQAFSLIGMMSCEALCKLLQSSLATLEAAKDKYPEIQAVYEDVEGFIYRLEHVDEEVQEEENEDEESSNQRILPQRAKLHELKATLQALSSRRRKSPYEKLREEILASLKVHFSQILASPMKRPLQEVLYFNDLAGVKEHIKAAPRCSIQRALTMPSRYLSCVCCKCDHTDILPSMPDLCIVYKLHLECGTMVNLYDWLMAFSTVLGQDSHSNGKKEGDEKKPSAQLRARFIRAVSELQFLGFVKPTRRKTDHVTRLTW